MTTANPTGISGTITTSGTKTFNTNNLFTFNGTAAQSTGALLPATVGALTINNTVGGTGGVTISNSALTITGITTLSAGALILPTTPTSTNLVTFTGNISISTGTITGSITSNIATSGTASGTTNSLVFTTGATNIRNWTCNATFGGASSGLGSNLTINGTFLFPTNTSNGFFINSDFTATFVSGSTFDQNFLSGANLKGAGNYDFQSGSTLLIGSTVGITATAATGAVQPTGSRTFSSGANYTFNHSTSAQAIGDAIDGTAGTGKTGPLTGIVTISNGNASSGVTLNAGTTITINTPGIFNIGVSATTSSILTAASNSVINGTGTINMLGNGATSGSTLITAHASGVNGTFATTTTNLTNGANNNTNFTFNAAAAQVTGSLLPAIVNNLNSSNSFSGANPGTPSLALSSSCTVNGTMTFAGGTAPLGLFSIGANTLTLNGPITNSNASKLIGLSTSNLIIGGSGTITATSCFASGGVNLNDFTLNRASTSFFGGSSLTVTGAFSLTNGILNQSASLTLNGSISLGAGQLRHTGGGLTIGGSGAITGNLTTSSSPLTLTQLTMNRSGQTLTLGSDISVSNATGLTLTDGIIATGANTLIVTGSTTGAIAQTNGWVNGNLQRGIATGTNTYNFPVGTTSNTPASVAFTSVTTAGTLTVKTTDGTHPNFSTYGLNASKYINRYWTLTNVTSVFTSASPTFTYAAGDVTGSALATALKTAKYTSSAWSLPTSSSTGSTFTATGITTFGDFMAGEVIATITTSSISGSPFCAGANVSVPYTTAGSFTGTFTAQLSDASGSFTSPVSIGTGASPISATIPSNTTTGSGYRIRVINATPAVTGSDNGSNLTINATPSTPSVTAGSATTFCTGGSVTLTSNAATGNQWYKDGSIISGQTATTYSATTSGSYTVISTVSNCPSVASSGTTVTVNPRPTVAISNKVNDDCMLGVGAVTITGSGGTGTLSITWTAAANTSRPVGATGSATGSPAGTAQTSPVTYTGLTGWFDYSFLVTDSNGCTAPSIGNQ